MRYRQKFVNQYVRINVDTNSEHILSLIKNVLDFNDKPSRLKPTININFFLNDIGFKHKPRGKSFFCSNVRPRTDIFIQSFGREIVRVEINRKKGTVRGTIAGYRDDIKEHIFHNLFTKPLQSILSYHGYYFIHSSVASKGDACVLIASPQNYGKTTISIVLSRHGFNLLTDDDCFIKLIKNDVRLFPFATKAGLTDKLLKMYPNLTKHIENNYRYGIKKRISMRHISKRGTIKDYKNKIILFPIYKPKSSISIKPITGDGIIKRIANEFPLRHIRHDYPERELEMKFLTFYALAKSARFFELTYNDDRLGEIPAVVRKIMKQ